MMAEPQLQAAYQKAWRRRAIFSRGWNLRILRDRYCAVLKGLLRDGVLDESYASPAEASPSKSSARRAAWRDLSD